MNDMNGFDGKNPAERAFLKSGERLDDLQIGGFSLIQKSGTFCLNTDSVLLADFAAPRRGERAADLGSGNGAVALLMAARQSDMQLDAVELQPQMADMAARSAAFNQIGHRLRVHCMDMRDAWRALGRQGMSLVVCNPPYWAKERSLPSARDAQKLARQEDDLLPEDVARAAEALLKYGGRFCAVYPASRALEMMQAMEGCGLAPKRIRTVHSFCEKPPKLVLLEAVKGGGKGLHWLPPLILYNAPGVQSAEYRRIYNLT